MNCNRDGICAWKVLTSSDVSVCHRFFWVTQLVHEAYTHVDCYPTGGSTRRGRQSSSASQHAATSVSVPPVAVAQSSEEIPPPSTTTPSLEKKPEVIGFVYIYSLYTKS